MPGRFYEEYEVGETIVHQPSRTVTDAEIIEAAPQRILASWCGKPFDREAFRSRPGYEAIPAIVNDAIVEIDSTIILQPGPAALTDGLDALAAALMANSICHE